MLNFCRFQELSRKRGPMFDDEDKEDKKKEAEEHNILMMVSPLSHHGIYPILSKSRIPGDTLW